MIVGVGAYQVTLKVDRRPLPPLSLVNGRPVDLEAFFEQRRTHVWRSLGNWWLRVVA